MTILLLTEPDYSLIQSIQQYLADKFNLSDIPIESMLLSDLPYYDGYDVSHLSDHQLISDYWGFGKEVVRVQEMTAEHIGDVIASDHIEPIVYFCDELDVAKRWLARYDSDFHTVAVDFETNDLTLPQFNDLTMVTIGWNLLKSTVIVFHDPVVKQYVLNWLVTTELTQVYHNSLFDLRHLHYHTGKLPKSIEDSQLLAAVYNNHVDSSKRISGLKALSGPLYKDWASDKSSFDLYDTELNESVTNLNYVGSGDPSIYNLALIKYCGWDALATRFAWDKFNTEVAHPDHWIMPTSEPRHNTEQFNQRYYYEFVLKPAIPLIVEMLNNGQAIDLDAVHKLKSEVEAFNEQTLAKINSYSIVQEFQSKVDQVRIDKFLEPVRKAMKQPKYAGYKNNVAMRTWIVNYFTGQSLDKVTAADLTSMDHPICKLLLDKQFTHPVIVAASCRYEEAECLRQNTAANRIDKLANPHKYVQVGFNPWNYQQLKQMWISFGLESDIIAKDTGEPSFASDVLKRLAKSTSGDAGEVINHYLEIAQSKNMITQYIPKYFGSTVDGRLFYALKLFGTFTGRLSGKAGGDKIEAPQKHQMGANGVTQPVGHRVYGKTVKSMFVAPPGRILAAVDYNGLENHINACLTKDETTIKLLSPDPETGLMWDMHTLHSTIFFKEEWQELTGKPFENTIQYNQMCYKLTDSDPKASALRSKSKPITFKLAYLGFPDDGKGGTITVGIHTRYHQELYPGVAAFTADYVIPTTNEHKSLHLNWGLRLLTDDPKGDLLSLNNANFQGYSNLTMIAGIKFRDLYLSEGNPHNIKGLNIIHDALYYELDDNPEAVKYLNDNLIACMVPDFLIDQTVHLRAECDFGYSQSAMVTIPNNASLEEITNKLKELS